jgi:hypothetical protein
MGRPVLMVVFGAGASKDALLVEHNETELLPVTDDLFDFEHRATWLRILNNYEGAAPAAQLVEARLVEHRKGPKRRRRRTVEDELGLLWREARKRGERRQHLLALQYYIRDVISGTAQQMLGFDGGRSNYIALVDRLEAWRGTKARIAYVTPSTAFTIPSSVKKWSLNRMRKKGFIKFGSMFSDKRNC